MFEYCLCCLLTCWSFSLSCVIVKKQINWFDLFNVIDTILKSVYKTIKDFILNIIITKLSTSGINDFNGISIRLYVYHRSLTNMVDGDEKWNIVTVSFCDTGKTPLESSLLQWQRLQQYHICSPTCQMLSILQNTNKCYDGIMFSMIP